MCERIEKKLHILPKNIGKSIHMDRGSGVRKVKRGFTDNNAHLNKVDFIVVVGVQHNDQNLH